jgi:hypothetical protein
MLKTMATDFGGVKEQHNIFQISRHETELMTRAIDLCQIRSQSFLANAGIAGPFLVEDLAPCQPLALYCLHQAC